MTADDARASTLNEAVALRVAALTALAAHEHATALALLGKARDCFAHLGDQTQVAWTLWREAEALQAAGRADDALRRTTAARDAFTRAGIAAPG